jgi:UTP:GlnB (protein PII) uridylyltransferase
VRAVAEHGGSLLVAVRAPDCVGLLATLMRRFACFSLFAVELRIDTRDGVADDAFWLRAGGHRRPAPATGPALRAALGHLLPKAARADR